MSKTVKKPGHDRPFYRFARSIYGEDLLENFLISAVGAVLLVRLFLHLTDYPQLGGAGLHIAHMLWGGLLMLVGLFLTLGFLSHPSHEWAAVLGGVGFGVFIDEMGKFITSDNNYFFQPAVAIIYVTFVLIYIAIRALFNNRSLSEQENLANAFELMKQGSINGLDSEDEQAVMKVLNNSRSDNPLILKLKEMLPYIQLVPSRKPYWLDRFKQYVDRYYQISLRRWWFPGAVVAFFAFTGITGFSAAINVVTFPWNLVLGITASLIVLVSFLQLWKSRIPNLQIPLTVAVLVVTVFVSWVVLINPAEARLPLADWALFITSSLTVILIIWGVVLMAHSRLQAYRMFHRAILVSILLTGVFAFYQFQFYALLGTALNILILVALRYLITHENIKLNPERNKPHRI
ncbi:MAG TPA: hypothetical protein VLH15_07850 [Dehalococcoidales bacterium]|nr:hypothetical protein [Dehalococcoidales bacterium]